MPVVAMVAGDAIGGGHVLAVVCGLTLDAENANFDQTGTKVGSFDGRIGLLDLAGNATLLYYMSEEAKEGKQAFIEKRAPDFGKFPRVP